MHNFTFTVMKTAGEVEPLKIMCGLSKTVNKFLVDFVHLQILVSAKTQAMVYTVYISNLRISFQQRQCFSAAPILYSGTVVCLNNESL